MMKDTEGIRWTTPFSMSRTALAAVFATETVANAKTADLFGIAAIYNCSNPKRRCPVRHGSTSFRSQHTRKGRAGFNLLEVTISTLLVGILLVGSMNTTGSLIRKHGVRAQNDVKLALAHGLLSEVQQAAFADPDGGTGFGVDGGEGSVLRSDFDDVDDYHNWNEKVVQDRDGQPLEGYAGYSRSVIVESVRLDDPGLASSASTDLKRVTVSVTGPDDATQSIVALRSRFSPLEVEPGVLSSYIRSVHVRLELDDASHPLDSGTAILNQVATEELP